MYKLQKEHQTDIELVGIIRNVGQAINMKIIGFWTT